VTQRVNVTKTDRDADAETRSHLQVHCASQFVHHLRAPVVQPF
jgi:hypothetical protein